MKLLKKLLVTIILVVLIISSIVIYRGHKLYTEAVDKVSIDKKIEEIKARKNYTESSKIPQDFKNAIIAIEDHRFYNHGAIDIISIGRSVVTNIKNMDLVEGGSTITQQLAKNMYFSQEKKFERKIAELFVAFDLQKELSKDDILELYLNIIYFGDGYTGIGNASLGYFNKKPNELTLSEVTLLAGLPNAPSAYALSSNSTLAKERQNMVIDAMYTYKYIDETTFNSLKKK